VGHVQSTPSPSTPSLPFCSAEAGRVVLERNVNARVIHGTRTMMSRDGGMRNRSSTEEERLAVREFVAYPPTADGR